MRNFTILLVIVACAFALTLGLDIYQRKLASPGKETVIFASMWAPGEPMQQAYEELFAQFEREYPQYHVEARWDGRWVLSAVRPRFLTRSDIPDVLNTDRDSLVIVVQEGYAQRLDDILAQEPHPDAAGPSTQPLSGPKFKDAFNPMLLAKCWFDAPAPKAGEPAPKYVSGTYLVPSGVWTSFIFYNRLHYEALGLTPPRKWSDLIANCQKLKAAGYAPFAADQDTYAVTWADLFLKRAVPEETLRATILNDGPKFNADPRYRAAFAAIQDQNRLNWMMPGWEGSQWPAAQRRWVSGEATHMLCGSYLIRETLAYEPDPKKFRLGGFLVPELDTVDWGGKPPLPMPDQRGVDAAIAGHALLAGGLNRRGAIELLRFLARRQSAGVLARVGKEIPPVVGAAFPPELEEIRADFQKSRTVFGETVIAFAPKWNQFVFKDPFHDFFMGPLRRKPVQEFLDLLQARTDAYHAKGSEGGYQ